MTLSSLYQTFQRYRTLKTHRISSLPIAILMPHSACNCRCVMCDIWKGNHQLKQLSEEDITGLSAALKKLGTKQVVMSGGEALLNSNFFRLCEMLRQKGFRITLLSTGLTIKKHAIPITEWVDEVIVSLDGNEAMHDAVRNVPGAYSKLAEGVAALLKLRPEFKVTGRSVIHRLNFRVWTDIIESARKLKLQQISFLPADVSSHAFNREILWDDNRQHELLPSKAELPEMIEMIEALIRLHEKDFENGFIAESPEKIRKIGSYYSAFYGHNEFPFKKCNAPWVSVVVESDGLVRPCFFHEAYGHINDGPFSAVINSKKAVNFRRGLDVQSNETCIKCVCSLNLPPTATV